MRTNIYRKITPTLQASAQPSVIFPTTPADKILTCAKTVPGANQVNRMDISVFFYQYRAKQSALHHVCVGHVKTLLLCVRNRPLVIQSMNVSIPLFAHSKYSFAFDLDPAFDHLKYRVYITPETTAAPTQPPTTTPTTTAAPGQCNM